MKRVVIVLGAVAAVLARRIRARVVRAVGAGPHRAERHDAADRQGRPRALSHRRRLAHSAVRHRLANAGHDAGECLRRGDRNGRVVVIDAGPGAWARLAGANIPGAKIDTVLLTHLHSDHIGDLGEVATQSWLGGRKVPLRGLWSAGAASLRAHHRRGGRDLRRGRHRGGGEGLRRSLQLRRRVPHRARPRSRADRSRAHDRP